MRIISGEFKGRRFHPPAKKWPTRPTTDISKEGLYNILQNQLDFSDAVFLDLFGGTGNHCYEFISRGCQDATYVDRFRPAVRFVQQMARELEIEPYLDIHASDVFQFIKFAKKSYTVIFAGPPYDLKMIPDLPGLILESSLLTRDGLFILEHNSQHHFEGLPHCIDVRQYGDTYFSFFNKNSQ